MATTPVAKERSNPRPTPQSDPRAPPNFPPSPPIPPKYYKSVPSPFSKTELVPPSPPDFAGYAPPSPLFSPPVRSSSLAVSAASPRTLPGPNFSDASPTMSSSPALVPSESFDSNFNIAPTNTPIVALSSSTTSAFTFSSSSASNTTSTSPLASGSSSDFLSVPKSPSVSPASSPAISPPSSPSLAGQANSQTPERSPRLLVPQLPALPPPSTPQGNNSNENPAPTTTPNFPPPPLPTSPKSPCSTTMNLLASLSAIPLSRTVSPTNSASPALSPASSSIAAVTSVPPVSLPPAAVLSPTSSATPLRIRIKHPSNSPTHLKIRPLSPPGSIIVKSPHSTSSCASQENTSKEEACSSSSSSASASSNTSSSSSVASSPASSFASTSSTATLSVCTPIPEGSSEAPDSPSAGSVYIPILRESSSSPPVPSSWGAEFRPDKAEKKKPLVLCGRCEKVVDRRRVSVDEAKKYPSFHSPIYEDPTNVLGVLKMSRQGLSRRLPMKTRWCVFNPALCALWYWRTSERGPKARCLFVTGVNYERNSLEFSLLLQFRGRVLVRVPSVIEYEKWKQGFSRAFDTGSEGQEALRIVVADEPKLEIEERERASSEIRPRASTLDRVRSIFVQEFNSTLWKPPKSAKKKNSVVEVRDESKGELWHVGSAPRIVRVDVP